MRLLVLVLLVVAFDHLGAHQFRTFSRLLLSVSEAYLGVRIIALLVFLHIARALATFSSSVGRLAIILIARRKTRPFNALIVASTKLSLWLVLAGLNVKSTVCVVVGRAPVL